jgi:hypothetical protein
MKWLVHACSWMSQMTMLSMNYANQVCCAQTDRDIYNSQSIYNDLKCVQNKHFVF